MKDTKIFCVVSLYQPTNKQVKTICDYSSLFYNTVVVDDTGEDCSYRDEFKKNENIEYIKNIKNEGLCRTINKGIKVGIKKGADWIIVMD